MLDHLFSSDLTSQNELSMKIKGEGIFGFKDFWYTLFLIGVTILNFDLTPGSFRGLLRIKFSRSTSATTP